MQKRWFLLLVLAFAWAGSPAVSQAVIPMQLAWQGVALDSNDVPLAAGIYTFHFAIFSDDVGGDSLWGESQGVQVEKGVLNVLLGRSNPIPDSVFASPSRYLQVQFETQAPYVPRTRIVSVGYAFRASSVDGASGGNIASGVGVAEAVATPELVIDPLAGTATSGMQGVATAGAQLRLESSANGGSADLYDENGDPTLFVAPDPDGEGGLISIGSNAAFTRGITLEGNGGGTQDPLFSLVGNGSTMAFDMSLPGDEAVSLPAGAIAAPELLDEPGLAYGVRDGAVFDIGQDYATLVLTTASFPADGFAVVIVEATFKAHEGNTWIDARLLEDGAPVAGWLWDPGDPDQWFDQHQSYVYAAAADAGPHTFELRIRQDHGSVDATDARATVLYFPTAYGAVDAVAHPLPEELPPVEQATPAIAPPLEPLRERSEAMAVNQARLESELAAMQARLNELQANLQATKALLESER